MATRYGTLPELFWPLAFLGASFNLLSFYFMALPLISVEAKFGLAADLCDRVLSPLQHDERDSDPMGYADLCRTIFIDVSTLQFSP
jgi:hypothetical protein